MELQRVGADDPAGVERLVDLLNEAAAADAPWLHPWTPTQLAGHLRHGWDGDPGEHYLAVEGGAVVGQLAVYTSSYDNPELGWLDVGIRPELRRRGHGSALLHAAYDVCRGLGRPLVGMAGWTGPRTEGFATAHGLAQKSLTAMRRQYLAEVDPGRVDEIAAEAREHARDYELVRLPGRTPEELLPALAELTASINDAPLDDLEIEDELFPPERIRAYETAQLARGNRLLRLVARHRPSGRLAGHTVVAVEGERPTIGDQHDTSVARADRGHRLGLLLKAEMLRWLREEEPQVETLDTFNAASNAHMVAVNEALGYRVVGTEALYQRRI